MIELNQIISKGDHLSSNLLEPLLYGIKIPEDNPYNAIAGVMLLVKLISTLGWIEHTSDWDLNMIITTRDNKETESGYGYGDCVELKNNGEIIDLDKLEYLHIEETKRMTLSFNRDDYDDDDEDLQSWDINIHDIKEITMDR